MFGMALSRQTTAAGRNTTASIAWATCSIQLAFSAGDHGRIQEMEPDDCAATGREDLVGGRCSESETRTARERSGCHRRDSISDGSLSSWTIRARIGRLDESHSDLRRSLQSPRRPASDSLTAVPFPSPLTTSSVPPIAAATEPALVVPSSAQPRSDGVPSGLRLPSDLNQGRLDLTLPSARITQ